MELRKELGFKDTDLSAGENRSRVAFEVGVRGLEIEHQLYKELVAHFGEIYVHAQRPLWEGGKRLDFYVYTPSGNFGVDVFCAVNTQSLKSNLIIKKRTYANYKGPLHLVAIGADPTGTVAINLDQFRQLFRAMDTY